MLKILRSKSYKPRYIVLTYKHFHFYFRILQRRLHTIVTILSANFVKFNSTYSSFHPTKVIEVRVIGGHTVYIYYLANFTAITFIIFIFFLDSITVGSYLIRKSLFQDSDQTRYPIQFQHVLFSSLYRNSEEINPGDVRIPRMTRNC